MTAEALVLSAKPSAREIGGLARQACHSLARGDLRLECVSLETLDSLGLAFFASLHAEAGRQGHNLLLVGLKPELRKKLAKIPAPVPSQPRPIPDSLAEKTGNSALVLMKEWRDLAMLLSESLYHSTLGFWQAKTILPGSTATQMVRLGSTALPIVLLLSVLIGFTLALQSGLQLEKYGAAIFLADGIGISMVTEIGPVMTAVILAGRSGSAVTAELAAMVVQEEISALQSLAINPVHFLVLPRFWALSITQPLLTVVSCLAGIGSGLVVGLFFFDLSPANFLGELRTAVPFNYVWQAAVKSVTFSWIIALIAASKGLGVRGGADAVGRATTECVVHCIFAIILADAAFSFIFYL